MMYLVILTDVVIVNIASPTLFNNLAAYIVLHSMKDIPFT